MTNDMARIEEEDVPEASTSKLEDSDEAAAREKERREQEALPYRWRQTLQDVSVTVPLPQKVKGRDCVVEIKKTTIKVGLKGQPAILEGELCKEVRVDDSTWTLDDRQEINLHLEKANQQTWWENVVKSAPKIDTTKIQPENSSLSDLDGDTRAMVEKMMFDNQQKQMGKPTSDELKKMEMLEKFQKQHPELDFSKAKVQ